MEVYVSTCGRSTKVEMIQGITSYSFIVGYNNVLVKEGEYERQIKLSDLRVVFDPVRPSMEHG